MATNIKDTSFDHYFNSKFAKTILFENGTFIITCNEDTTTKNNYGKLPDGVVSKNVVSIRMAEHIGPPGIECGPVAVFILSNGIVLIYEYWTNNAVCEVTGTNGFWISTNLYIDKNYRLHCTELKLQIITTIDEEKSCGEVKFTKHSLCIGSHECYDL